MTSPKSKVGQFLSENRPQWWEDDDECAQCGHWSAGWVNGPYAMSLKDDAGHLCEDCVEIPGLFDVVVGLNSLFSGLSAENDEAFRAGLTALMLEKTMDMAHTFMPDDETPKPPTLRAVV